jgi:hypothetical protein
VLNGEHGVSINEHGVSIPPAVHCEHSYLRSQRRGGVQHQLTESGRRRLILAARVRCVSIFLDQEQTPHRQISVKTAAKQDATDAAPEAQRGGAVGLAAVPAMCAVPTPLSPLLRDI